MRTVTITFKDGSSFKLQNVPADVTPDQVLARVAQRFPDKEVAKLDGGRNPAKAPAVPGRDMGGMQGYMDPSAQQAGWQQYQAGETLPGDQVNPVPQARPPVDPTYPDAPRAGAFARPAAAAPAIGPLEGVGPGGEGGQVNPEFDTGARPDQQEATAPSGWRGTVYGIGGGIAGGLAGALGGPVTAAVAGVAGSALGTYKGTFDDAIAEGKDEETASAEALKAAGIDIAFNVAGGAVIKVAGKVIKLKTGTSAYDWLLSKLPKQAADKLKAKPLAGESVFDTTTQGQLDTAAEAGAKSISSPEAMVTPGQLTGQASILESASRSAAPGVFNAAELVQKRKLEDEIKAFRATLRGDAQDEFPGTALRRVLTDVEDRVKAYSKPVWERLANSRDINIVDASNLRALAKGLLANKDSFGAMDATERALLEKISRGGAKISPAEAQDVQSRFFGRARDLESSANPDSRLKALYDQMAGMMRGNLDGALEDAVRTGGMAAEDLALIQRVRDLYRTMNERVYNPALKGARRDIADEKVAGAVVRPGDVTSVRQLDALTDFAKQVDDLGSVVFKGAPGQAERTASTATRAVAVAGATPSAPVGTNLPTLTSKPRDVALFTQRAEAAGKMGPEAAARFRADYGIPEGRPLADVAREALNGIRERFFHEYAGTPEALARLHQQMGKPKFKETFDALFPAADVGQRQAIEKLSQAAQIWARKDVKGSVAGQQALASEAGRRALGPVAGLAARAFAIMTPAWLARNYTKPGFNALSSWLIGAANGTAGKAPAAVYNLLGEDRAEYESVE